VVDKNILFSFKVRTDEPYGIAYVVGATVWDLNNPEFPIDHFVGMADVTSLRIDEWFRRGDITALSVTRYLTIFAMRNAFWDFYEKYRESAIIVVDGSPRESKFIESCVEDYYGLRIDKASYPLHDLRTILFAYNIDPNINRLEFSGMDPLCMVKGNPIDDSVITAKIFMKVMSMYPQQVLSPQ
jgi:hypothetical protein